MFNYCLPLSLEEQAIMLLYDQVRPHVRDTVQDHDEVMKAITAVITQIFAVQEGNNE